MTVAEHPRSSDPEELRIFGRLDAIERDLLAMIDAALARVPLHDIEVELQAWLAELADAIRSGDPIPETLVAGLHRAVADATRP